MDDGELRDVTPIGKAKRSGELSGADEIRSRMYREQEARRVKKLQQVKRCACAGCRELDVHVFKVAGAVEYVCTAHCFAFENDEKIRAADDACELLQVELDAHVNAGRADVAVEVQKRLHGAEAAYRQAFRDWLAGGGKL